MNRYERQRRRKLERDNANRREHNFGTRLVALARVLSKAHGFKVDVERSGYYAHEQQIIGTMLGRQWRLAPVTSWCNADHCRDVEVTLYQRRGRAFTFQVPISRAATVLVASAPMLVTARTSTGHARAFKPLTSEALPGNFDYVERSLCELAKARSAVA